MVNVGTGQVLGWPNTPVWASAWAGSIIDSDITYPANVVLEIMSYQGPSTSGTKIGGEFDFGPLTNRLGHPKQAGVPSTGLLG